jgi:uncharacterized protein
MEKAICVDAQLSALDEKLAAAYKTARAGLSTEAAKDLAGGQASWLKFHSKSCFVTRDASPASDGDAASCLKEAYQERITRLQDTGKIVSGFKTYWVNDSAFTSFPQSGQNGAVERNFMQVDDTSAAAMSLNTLMRGVSQDKASVTQEEAGTESETTVSLEALSPDVLEIRTNSYVDMGGVHPDEGMGYRYFSKGMNRAIEFRDLFSSDAWREVAMKVSQETLARSQLEPISDAASVFGNVNLSDPFGYSIQGKKGFMIERSFLSYAERAEDVIELSWSAFEGLLTPYAKDQIAQFTATN